MTGNIHPTAIISPEAKIGQDVTIGPYCIIGSHVSLGDRVELKAHVVVEGHTEIGEDTIVFPFTSLGTIPQDLKFSGEEARLLIGKRNRIREHVTMNIGTKGGGMETRMGDDCLIMVGAHLAHDVTLGNHVILANNATLAGHVTVGDHAIIGGLSAVRQFVRIGAHAMIGGMSGVENDVIPYGVVMGERAKLHGLNLIGLQRRGFSKDSIRILREAYEEIFLGTGETIASRIEAAAQKLNNGAAEAQNLIDFVRGRGKLGLVPVVEHKG